MVLLQLSQRVCLGKPKLKVGEFIIFDNTQALKAFA